MTQPGYCGDGPFRIMEHIDGLQEYRNKFELISAVIPERAMATTMLADLDKAIALLKLFAERMHALQLIHGRNRQNH